MGVQGVSEYEREALILSSSLGASLASFWASRKKLAARRRRNPPAKNHRSGAPGRGPGQPLLPLRGNSPSRALRGGRNLPPHPSRLRRAAFPYPLCRCATSPLDKGSRPPEGKVYWEGPSVPLLRRRPDRDRWFVKPRRGCGTATAANFANPGPSGPAEI